jgi:hypothetical protein
VSDPKPLDRLARVADEAFGDDPRPATFVRGLALGALVGAAIAGSTIWQRRRAAIEAAADAEHESEGKREP